jgi:hypothetical protein
MKTLLTTTAVILALSAPAAWAKECSNITKDEVIAAQKKWGDGIVTIGKAEDHKAAALNHLNTLYGYDMGEVLFKPTKAAEDQFRGSKDEALSYFVKGNVPEDKGFALAPYTKVRFENEGIVTDCDSAMAMGNYYFTTTEGKDIKVEYSFGYVKDDNGKLKINLHHSSLPYHN